MYKLTVIAVLLCLVTSLHSLIQHSVILKKHNSISNHRIYSSNTPNADTSSSVASSFARDDDDVKIDFDELAAESAAAAFVTKVCVRKHYLYLSMHSPIYMMLKFYNPM